MAVIDPYAILATRPALRLGIAQRNQISRDIAPLVGIQHHRHARSAAECLRIVEPGQNPGFLNAVRQMAQIGSTASFERGGVSMMTVRASELLGKFPALFRERGLDVWLLLLRMKQR
jgi:hypothetical protein